VGRNTDWAEDPHTNLWAYSLGVARSGLSGDANSLTWTSKYSSITASFYGLVDKAAADHAPYDAWRRQGHLQVTPGASLDYDFIAVALRDLFRRYNVRKIAYDPWHWDFFKPSLLRASFTEGQIAERFQEFAQTTKMISLALANLERSLLDGRLVHDNPIPSMCVAHTTIRTDSAANRAPDKRRATHRIDGTVALVMGLAMATTAQAQTIDVAALIG
jgi:phage terminase large subunit-like protein